ncbi:MAG: cupin domain-containing protein [Rhodothermales bacterium]|nr:cupin domain-containing protein [Rhodothermales bacterium]
MATEMPLRRLGDLDVAAFMETCWQKKPVLLRGVLPRDFCPLTREDLTQLACSEEADSRLIISEDWPPELYHGPFEPEELEDVPDREWTLLVQEVDRLVPGASRVLDHFRFIPNWRVDDLMVSYAAPGGGVGAHTDQYDVFLIQGLGRRRWEIDATPNRNPVWREDSEVAVLADFSATDSWEVEPGDVLYLPPHVAHNGIALTDCMTLSVGFRAPDAAELLESVLGYLSDSGKERYLDPDPRVAPEPGEISGRTLADLRSRVRALLGDDELLNQSIGRALTEPVRGRLGVQDAVVGELPTEGVLHVVSAAQAAHVLAPGNLVLFVAGKAYPLPVSDAAQVASLTGTAGLNLQEGISDALRQVLGELVAEGLVRLG